MYTKQWHIHNSFCLCVCVCVFPCLRDSRLPGVSSGLLGKTRALIKLGCRLEHICHSFSAGIQSILWSSSNGWNVRWSFWPGFNNEFYSALKRWPLNEWLQAFFICQFCWTDTFMENLWNNQVSIINEWWELVWRVIIYPCERAYLTLVCLQN